MKILVMKFGGTSVGSPEAITQAVQIVERFTSEWDRIVVVVSAMSGVTNALTKCARAASLGDETTYRLLIAELQASHHNAIRTLIPSEEARAQLFSDLVQHIDELSAFCRSIHVLGEVTPRGMDRITSLGERMNARVVAAVLEQAGTPSQAVNATTLIVTDDAFQNAVPLMEITSARVAERLIPLMDGGVVPVVTGFIGSTQEGVTTTLGRGGSDYTAAILGACLNAGEVWTWTDVDGVMTADPRIVPEAQVIPELSYQEVSELAYFGAKVLHPKTIRPLIENDIPLWVKNTFNPEYPGTRISRERKSSPGKITAIAKIPDLSLVTVEGRGMLGVPGIAARTFSAVAREGASVLMISQASSEQSICFVIPTGTVEVVIRSIEDEMALELARQDIERVWARQDVVIVTAVGDELRNTPGVAARIFSALGKTDINVIAIAQGASEYSVSIVVSSEDGDRAMQQLHADVILNS